MFREAKIQNANVWKSQKPEFQCLEKAKIQNSNVWKSQKPEFQCLEKPKFIIPMFGKTY